MLLSLYFAVSVTVAAAQASPPAQTEQVYQTANGGKPQKVPPRARSRQQAGEEHWSDGMNTTHTPTPPKRDEYGAPKVTPPRGQGTDNAGGLPAAAVKTDNRRGAGDHVN
jgi:hypothetical protein